MTRSRSKSRSQHRGVVSPSRAPAPPVYARLESVALIDEDGNEIPSVPVSIFGSDYVIIPMKQALEEADARLEADANAIGATFYREKTERGFVHIDDMPKTGVFRTGN